MNLKTPSWYSLAVQNGGDVEVFIYDEIGIYGVSAKSFIEELASVPNATSLTLRVNSPGGSVFDALAIYNVLKGKSIRKVCIVDGLAASAASFIPMACDEIRMHENSFMFLHNPWTIAAGNADQLRGEADALEKMQDQLVSIYAGRTGMPREAVEQLLDAESWLTADECKASNLCDVVLGAHAIAASYNPKLYKDIPCEIAAMLRPEEPAMDEQPIEPVVQPSVEPVASAVEPVEPEAVPVAAPVIEPVAAIVDSRSEFKRFVERFGASLAAEYFASGKSYDEAEREYFAAIERENAELKAKAVQPVVAQEPSRPVAFDGHSEAAKTFTRAQIKAMSSEEYKQNREAIISAERSGRIK